MVSLNVDLGPQRTRAVERLPGVDNLGRPDKVDERRCRSGRLSDIGSVELSR